jgi:hypothetical protein
MKFIKKFNESKIDLQDVKKYCNECLAYLIDEGFVVYVTSPGFYYYQIEFIKETKQSFSFDVIKDDFLTFLEAIQNKYEILGLERTNTYNIVINGIKSGKQYYYMDLIDENFSVDFPIHSIIFRIDENPQ